MSIENRVRTITVRLLEEMRAPLHTLEGAYLILRDVISPDEMPPELAAPLRTVGRASAKIKDESHYLIRFAEDEFAVGSPVRTASQIRRVVSRWRKYVKITADAIRQIQELRATGFRVADPQFDAILGEVLLSAFWRLLRWLDYLSTIEGKELVYGVNKRTLYLYHTEDRSLKDSEVGYPTTSIARWLVYELTWPLEGLKFGYSSLNENAPPEILAAMDAIGQCSEKFQDEVRNFGDAFLKETDLTPAKAAERIRQQVKVWKAYENELSHAIWQIREALAAGLRVDADTAAVIAGAFFDAFEHLEREMRRLETIKAEDF